MMNALFYVALKRHAGQSPGPSKGKKRKTTRKEDEKAHTSIEWAAAAAAVVSDCNPCSVPPP